jgi:sulfate/thiosulfate transport system substrate-binding protein
MKNAPKFIAYTALAAALVLGFAVTAHGQDRTLVNVSYDPTRELYQQFNEAFIAHWQAEKAKLSPSRIPMAVPAPRLARSSMDSKPTS